MKTSQILKSPKTLLKKRIHNFKKRFLNQKTMMSSLIKPFTRRLNVWGEGGSFFTYRPHVKQIVSNTDYVYQRDYPLFTTDTFTYVQEYSLMLAQQTYIKSKPLQYVDMSRSGYGQLSTFMSHNSSVLIAKFFRYYTNTLYYDNNI